MITGLLTPSHVVILLIVVLLILGPRRLPQAGRASGYAFVDGTLGGLSLTMATRPGGPAQSGARAPCRRPPLAFSLLAPCSLVGQRIWSHRQTRQFAGLF